MLVIITPVILRLKIGKKQENQKQKNGITKKGIIAWLTWGADPGLTWVNSKTTLLNKVFNKNYQKIG